MERRNTGELTAEILSTGNEVLTGALTDTNTSWLSHRLEQAGVAIRRHNCAGDEIDLLVRIMREIASRADIAIVTGGLGPTTDDITAEAAAQAAGTVLTENPEALASVSAFFARRGWEIKPGNRKQGLAPEGASIIPNDQGTAPGFYMDIDGCRFFFLPGVPHEMKTMFDAAVVSVVRTMQGANHPVRRVLTVSSYGLGESAVGLAVKDLESVFPDLKLGLRARFPVVQIKCYGSAPDAAALNARLAAAEKWIRDQLGDALYAGKDISLADAVGDALKRRGETLALAESCTGGLMAHELTQIPGSSDSQNG